MRGPGSDRCSENLEKIKKEYAKVGMLLEREKEEGLATLITFLGIELDMETLCW